MPELLRYVIEVAYAASVWVYVLRVWPALRDAKGPRQR